ncbi:hypothetical protein RND81_05G249000 [Saponaria officinalis]|uniref:AP2/ERF domain-containing protein n=1 Tax=Saponaria officinalis TaxID=3572 RepID=A0AAW1L3I6_SAPOF
MNTHMSYQTPHSPSSISSGGESEDAVSSLDSSAAAPVPPVLYNGGTAVSLSQKRKAGRKKFRETRHPIYHGVRHRDDGKWVREVRKPQNKSRVWLGTYPTAELAARAYDVGALALRGQQTALNFPDSIQLAPKPKSNSARDLRLAALQATRFDLTCPSSLLYENCKKKEEKNKTCSTSYDVIEKSVTQEWSRGVFWDEEALFNMPTLIDSMAEAMLLTPPALKKGVNWDEIYQNNEYDSYVDLNLW